MQMYQQYHERIQEKQYALRGSVLACEYGEKYARLDCMEDHGIIKGKHPIFTALDCLNEHIHDFGSCLCPESSYKDRLPMTSAVDTDGNVAKKAEGNAFPHICIPLVDEKYGWLQTEKKVMVQIDGGTDALMLKSDAVLVCQYGGIIGILEVPEVEEVSEEKMLVTLENLKDFGFFMGLKDSEKEEGVITLNKVLNDYDITTDEQIAAFMGQVAHETGLGVRTLEQYEGNAEEYFIGMYWTEEKARNALKNEEPNDGQLYRGAGYLHLTGRGNYTEFGKYIGNEDQVLEMGYKIVGGVYNQDVTNLPSGAKGFIKIGEYAWEAAGWFWKYGNPSGESLNIFVENHDWDSISANINPKDIESFPKRKQKIKEFYFILTGKSLDAS